MALIDSGAIHFESKEIAQAEIACNKQLALANDVDRYLTGAGQIVNGMKKIGLDGETLKIAETAVVKGTQASSVFRAIVNDQPLAAIGGLVGLLFGGGPDIDELRHQQTMGEFAELKRNQKVIHDEIKEVQKHIGQLTDLVWNVMDAIQDLDGQVRLNRELLLMLVRKDVTQLRTLLDELDACNSYEEKRRHFGLAGNSEVFNKVS